jgi:tetratricopeptide (TPR) repeat protein
MDEGESSETLKAKANDCFAKRDFSMAAELYSKAIEKEQTDKSLLAILYSNRSAAKIELGQDMEAVDDASIALGFNPTYLKAYLRKATALLRLGDEHGSYKTWMEAGELCEHTQSLKKQLKDGLARWQRFYNKVPVVSFGDMIERYALIGSNTRMKLSTLAHFWNISSKLERLDYLRTFLALIGGEGNLSEGISSLLLQYYEHSFVNFLTRNMRLFIEF